MTRIAPKTDAKSEATKRQSGSGKGSNSTAAAKGSTAKSTQRPPKKDVSSEKTEGSLLERCMWYLWEPEDSSYLAFFRILWGLVMTLEVWRFIENEFVKTIYSFYSNPYGWTCKYWAFEWVHPPADIFYMEVFLYIMFAAGLGITFGFLYRPCSIVYFFGISYIYLLESASYLNHIYLTIVMAFLMIFVPCECAYSIDSWRNPQKYKSDTVPKIVLLFLRWVLIIVYAFAGVVKINEDWLRNEPLRHWVCRKYRAFPPFSTILGYDETAYFMSYGGMIYDLLVGPLLLWDRTFWLGIFMTLFFHTSNKILFNIGIFPYLMIASTSLFFSPEWPRKLNHLLSGKKTPYVPVAKQVSLKTVKRRKITSLQKLIVLALALFLVFWLLFPLRHYTIDGEVVWNEAGHKYSWRMKLRDKDCTADVYAFQPVTNTSIEVPVPFLCSSRQYPKVLDRPWMMTQLAHFIADLYAVNGVRAEVYFHSDCQVNYRPRQPYSDPTVNLAERPKFDEPYPWITELQPLTEDAKKDFPWNWEWNFNYLKGNFTWMPPIIEQEERQRAAEVSGLTDMHRIEFQRFIAKKHFGGNIAAVGGIHHYLPPPQMQQVQWSSRALKYFYPDLSYVPWAPVPPHAKEILESVKNYQLQQLQKTTYTR